MREFFAFLGKRSIACLRRTWEEIRKPQVFNDKPVAQTPVDITLSFTPEASSRSSSPKHECALASSVLSSSSLEDIISSSRPFSPSRDRILAYARPSSSLEGDYTFRVPTDPSDFVLSTAVSK